MKRYALLFILIVAIAFLLLHLNEPLTDGMAVKQIFVAHKARSIAAPPFDLTRNTFDFLEPNGERLSLTEEVPLYTGLVAVGYRIFGEHECIGRVLSILATFIAILAVYDWVRRDIATNLAIPATAVFALSPLLRVYGQTVQPDSWMLACMVLASCAWSRFLERKTLRWWLAALCCVTIGALFKYYALMAVVPLAFQTFRAAGWRFRSWAALSALAAIAVVPVGAWMTGKFAATPNPTRQIPYFIVQMPELIVQNVLYLRFCDRFLWKDCGPVAVVLIGLGVIAAFRRRADMKPLIGWTATGLGFFVLMGPMLRCHDYYELMMLPAASVWAALGWRLLESWRRSADAESVRPTFVPLVLLALVHSPWISRNKSDVDRSYAFAAEQLARATSPHERIAVVAGDNSVALVHYAHREGWISSPLASADDGRNWLEQCRRNGVAYAVIFRQRNEPAKKAVLDELAAGYVAVACGANYDVVRLADATSASSRHDFAR